MAVYSRRLWDPTALVMGGAGATLYTAPAGSTVVLKRWSGTLTGAGNLRLYLQPGAGAIRQVKLVVGPGAGVVGDWGADDRWVLNAGDSIHYLGDATLTAGTSMGTGYVFLT